MYKRLERRVGIRATAIGRATCYGLGGLGVGVRISVPIRFLRLHVVQTGCEAHPASYTMAIEIPFPGDEPAGA
jgi:hypothetical protein